MFGVGCGILSKCRTCSDQSRSRRHRGFPHFLALDYELQAISSKTCRWGRFVVEKALAQLEAELETRVAFRLSLDAFCQGHDP